MRTHADLCARGTEATPRSQAGEDATQEGITARQSLLKELLIAEAIRRGILGGKSTVGTRLEDETFPQQKAFIVDESPRVTICTPRRAAKTEGIIRKMLRKMKLVPGSIVPYISITRENAKRNIWQRLQVMNSRYDLGLIFNHSDLTARDPSNGSVIWVTGLATQAELAKLRGNRYDLVVVDECQDILIDFENFIQSVIVPALGDRRGQLVLAGTPDPWRRNKFWFAAVTSEDPRWRRWTRHSWLLTDNIFFKDPAAYLREVLEEEGYTVDDPRYQAEYLGLWAVSTSNLIVDSYKPSRNDFHGSEWDLFTACPGYHYLLSVKFRFKRPSAFVVACYSSTKRHAIFAESSSGLMDVSQAITVSTALMQKFPIEQILVDEDEIGKDFSEELNARYPLPIEPVQKRDPRMRHSFLNADLRTGRLQVIPDLNKALIGQWANVMWDKDRQKPAEGQECDIFDPAGYAHMACRSFFEAEAVTEEDWGMRHEREVMARMGGERMEEP